MAICVNWVTYTDERDYDCVESTLWIRGYQLMPYLEKRGVRCLVNARDVDADVVVFLRKQDAEAQAWAAEEKRKGRAIVFDLCVNYFDETGLFEGGYGATRQRVEEAKAMLEAAAVVTCASETIAERAAEFHDEVVCLPDSVDGNHFAHEKPLVDFDRPRLRAVWCGVSTKAIDLDPVLPLLRRHGFGLTVISDRDPFPRFSRRWLRWKRSLRYRFVPWHYRTFPAEIVKGDVCISPRDTSSPYNRGHSAFKIAVFMAEGVPAIASPVPAYAELIGRGRGGAVCENLADWDRVFRLVQDERSLLVRWSEEARDAVSPYSTERIADRYADLFLRLARRSRNGAKA